MGCLLKKTDTRQNHTYFCLMQGVNLCEVEISVKEEAFGGIERGRLEWRFGVCLSCLIGEELELHVMVQDVGEKCAGNPPVR